MSSLSESLAIHGVGAEELEPLASVDGREIPRLAVPGVSALAVWKRLRELSEELRSWPVLAGPPGCFAPVVDENRTESLEEVVRRGETRDLDRWVRRGLARMQRLMFDSLDDELADLVKVMDHAESIAAQGRPRRAAARSFAAPLDEASGDPLPLVAILLVPTRKSWRVPGFLGLGGWGECPSTDLHVALMMRWHERYGAELVSVDERRVELSVTRPPTEDDAALAAAREHYLYCPDVVDRDAGTFEALAEELKGAPIWRFQWESPRA
jgi:hypothetical protein